MPPSVVDVYIVIVVLPVSRPCVVRRVDVDAIHLAGVEVFEELEGMVVIGFDEGKIRELLK